MTSAGVEDADTVLSDVEGDDPVPVPIVIKNSSQEDVSVERFRELLAEVDRERQAREAAENSKSELQVAFNRLKALAHEAIKKRDESTRQRDEALREKEEALKSNDKVSGELVEVIRLRDEVMKQKDEALKQRDEVLKQKDEALKQRDEIAKQLDEAVKAREVSRSEIETSAQMLVSGIEKISGKVRTFKNFTAGGLPRSQKYTGLPAIAYGVIKRSNEIVEELVRQMDATTKSRNEAREQMDHRNYEIAIEVSQLEATISGLREEVSKKNSVVENLEKSIAEKDAKISDMERDISEKIQLAESERAELKEIVSEYDLKLGNFESIMESQRPLLINQLNLVSKIHDRIYDVIRIIDDNKLDQSEVSESLFLPQATDMEENVRASLAGMESIYELTRMVGEKIRNLIEDHGREAKSLNETVTRLVKEKEQIGSFLRNALSRRMALDPSSKMKELFHVAENGSREAGIEFKFSNLLEDGKVMASHDKAGVLETEEDELYNMTGALEHIVKASQLEIIELQHSVDELRAESVLLKEHMEAQAKELNHRQHRIEELEEKERMANENIEGLMMDIAAAEEEITRWKVAAEQEAAAGRAVEQEFMSQLSAIREELEEAKQAVMESEKKLKFKEETAAAAMEARDAAEKSLRLADLRASRLRDRVEELTHQLEESETRQDSRKSHNGPRYVCWPWEWLGLNFVGLPQPGTNQQNSNEMELSEPLL